MNELMYDFNSGLIALALLVTMVGAIEAGYRIGFRHKDGASDAARDHVYAIQASILGILALLLGFTFSLSLQRYDNRSEAVVEEANAIGTTYLRAQLLAGPIRNEVQSQLRDYLDLRVQASAIPTVDHGGREALLSKSSQLQTSLWGLVRQAAANDPNPVTTGLYVQALNELIDSYGRRDAALNRHVPELVLMLLYATFLLAGGIVGFAAGVAGHRPSLVSYLMVMLMVILVFIILDLDRPRRGLILVSQKPLLDLQAGIAADADNPVLPLRLPPMSKKGSAR